MASKFSKTSVTELQTCRTSALMTSWKDWPNKITRKSNTEKNFKRRRKRSAKKSEDNAKKALESGSVVVLIEEDIPKGAISILGKVAEYYIAQQFIDTLKIKCHPMRII